MQFEFFNGEACVCLPGYNRINGACVRAAINDNITKCQALANREWINNVCSCKTGYLLANNECIKIATSGCPINSYNNGLGTCICDLGYYKDLTTKLCLKGDTMSSFQYQKRQPNMYLRCWSYPVQWFMR